MLCFTNTPVLAALESVPTITVWCDYAPRLGAVCSYHTDLEAAQAYAAFRATDKWLIPIVIDSCDGNGNCICHYLIGPDAGKPVVMYRILSVNICPEPISYPNIKYEINSVSGLCERNTPVKLNITLSGGAITRPWHKKFDKNHDLADANLPYKAIVLDQNGQPKANISVTVTTDVVSGSGGHAHYYARPKGRLVDKSGVGTSTLAGRASIFGFTDSNGVFAFTFGSEEASGTHIITASCDANQCQSSATASVEVAISDLMQLGVDAKNYTLNGSTTPHPNSHYFSAAALIKISDFANTYADKKNFGELLIINDSSLEKGGVLDLGQDWTFKPNGHQGHRKGVVVDINNYRTTRSLQFEKFALISGIKAVWEGPGMTKHPHYHLWLLGSDQ